MKQEALQFAEEHGRVSVVRADEVDGRSCEGWRLIATVPDTLVEQKYVSQSDGRPDAYVVEKTEITRFVMVLPEDDALARASEELKQEHEKLVDVGGELHAVKRKAEETAQVTAKETERLRQETERLRQELERANARAETASTEHEKFLGMWKALIGDPEVHDAVLAAITASGRATAKQLITDYMAIRLGLGSERRP
jgi:HAMP domain-containing protein